MRHLALDVEASDLISPLGKLPDKIFCICTEDLETGEQRDFVGEECYTKFPEYASQFDKFIAHNAIGYDVPVLSGLTDFKCKLSQVIDTLVFSKIMNPDRLGGHSLKSWGERFKFPKGDWTDFSKFSPGMLKYCRQDTSILRKVYFRLKQEQSHYSVPWKAIQSEHIVAYHIVNQGWNGFAVDIDAIDRLHAEVSSKADALELSILRNFKPIPKPFKGTPEKSIVIPKYKQDGSLSIVGLKFLGDDWTKVNGPLTRIEWVPFDLHSPKQVVERMNRLGWNPEDKTKGHIEALKEYSRKKKLTPEEQDRLDNFKIYGWKVNEKNLSSLPEDAPEPARHIADYVMLNSRRKLIEQQWWPNIQEDERIHGYCDPLGAGTHRMTHNGPNLANIPAVLESKETGKALKGFDGRYGWDSRNCFTVSDPEKYSLVGTDASGLELRMLAHFMGDPEYVKAVLGDPHTVNQKAAGLDTRAQAKTFIYGFLYGAGAAKLGTIVGGSYKEGQELKERFLAKTPALKRLIDKVEREAREKGYVRGLDGRVIFVRSSHAALNTLLQGNGAIVCKYWLIYMMKGIQKYGLDVKLVASVHDEYQRESYKDHIELLKKIDKAAMKKTQEVLKVTCPLDCESKEGLSWAMTH